MSETQTKEKPITRDLTIGEVILEYPEIIPKLQEHGIHCIGCHVAAYEKIGEGFLSHGFSEEQVDKIIDELNGIVKDHHVQIDKKEPEKKSIDFTPDAASKLKELMKKQKKEKYGVRIQALPGGCSGYVYGMEFEEEAKEGDILLESRGLKIFVDKESIHVLGGTVVDYVDNLNEQGFKFENPNATKGCGCGKSFA